MTLQRVREGLSLILLALLPFHALFVTVITKIITGPGHAPLPQLAVWKEGVLGLILLIGLVEVKKNFKRFDRLDVLIILLIILSVAVTAMTHGDWKLYLFGFKYDFIPLIAFLILRRVEWSQWFWDQVMKVLLVVGCIVALYGLATFVLPMSWFMALGYSDLHSLYVPGGPLAAFQQIGESGIRRIQGPMSGPNQLGVWLLIPLGIALSSFMKGDNRQSPMKGFNGQIQGNNDHYSLFTGDWKFHWRLAISALLLVAIIFTFSRSAWIAAAVMIALTLWNLLPRRYFVALASGGIVLVVIGAFLFPSVFFRITSSRGHIEKPLAAIQTMIAHPLGLGLGTAGPASNRVSDTCVMLEEGSDPSWAQERPDLCVFVGASQVQPMDRDCQCPRLTENWYLQMGVEMGWVGMVMYVVLVVMVLMRLQETRNKKQETNKLEDTNTKNLEVRYCNLNIVCLLSLVSWNYFFGISIAALFLHAWEDSATAYTAWILIASVGVRQIER